MAIVAIVVMAAPMLAMIRPITLFLLTNRLFTYFLICRPLSWYQGPVKLVDTRRYGICLTTKIVLPFVVGAGAGC
jgi:hypothetical protein